MSDPSVPEGRDEAINSDDRLLTIQEVSELTGLAVSNEMNAAPQTDWLTVAEAAGYLKVKPRSLLLWVRQGKVRGYALSGTKRRVWRFRVVDLDAALFQNSVVPSASGVRAHNERSTTR